MALCAGAVPLAVDADGADAARAAIATLWPGGPVELVAAPLGREGFAWSGGALEWRRDGVVVERAEAVDAATAILLARSWYARAPLPDVVPPIPFDVVDVEPDPSAPDPEAPRPLAGPWILAGVDAGGSLPPALRTGVGWSHGPVELDVTLAIALRGAWHADVVAGSEGALRVAGVGAVAAWDCGVPRRVRGRVTLAPLLTAGIEVGITVDRAVTPARDLVVDPPRSGGSLVAGAGVDLWLGAAVGLRPAAVLRTSRFGIDGWGSLSLAVGGR